MTLFVLKEARKKNASWIQIFRKEREVWTSNITSSKLAKNYFAKITLPKLLCQNYFAKITLQKLLCKNYFAKITLQKLLCKNYFAKITLPKLLCRFPMTDHFIKKFSENKLH
jgi:hypothetical protein